MFLMSQKLTLYNYQCRVPWHEYLTCQEYSIARSKGPHAIEAAMAANIKEQMKRICPNQRCRTLNEKDDNDGYLMTCMLASEH